MDEEIGQLLANTLSPDPNVRLGAELRLNQLGNDSQAGVSLARIAVNAAVAIHLRQMTSFSLKKYVKEHWSPFFSTFKDPPATNYEAKAVIRELIFGGLSDPTRKIRLACAAIISEIAHPDWPDDWPSLTTQLLTLITGTPNEVEGGMRVLNDFVGIDLTEDQLLPIARDLLPRLLTIVGMHETYSASTRARAILIFRQCVMTLFTVKDEYPVAVKAAVGDILPMWIEAFKTLLQADPAKELQVESAWEGSAIRVAIYNSLEVMMNAFPSVLKPSLTHFLHVTISHLSLLHPLYEMHYLSSTSDALLPASTGDEDSDVPSDLPGLVAAMMDFTTQAARRKGCREMFVGRDGSGTPLLESSSVVALAYAMMTVDDEESWANDPNAFVADEDDEMVGCNVRISGIDFITALVDTYEVVALRALWSAFQTRAAAADSARERSEEDWWKVYEGALAVVGAVSSDILENVLAAAEESQAPAFDLGLVFTAIIPTYLTASEIPFLQGRSFVFASQFAKALPDELANQYIDAAITVVDTPTASAPVKISAVRALNNFFRHLYQNIDPVRATSTMRKLLVLLPQTTDNTMILIVETLDSTLKVGGTSLSEEECGAVVEGVLQCWFGAPEDPMLGASVCEFFESFSKILSPAVERSLLQYTLPALSRTMTEYRTNPYSPLASRSVDLIDSVFDGRPMDSFTPGLFATVAEVLFELLIATDDRGILQSGLHVITTVVRKDIDQLLNWRDASNRSGLELVLSLVAKLLEPSESESGGLFVGDLVIHLIRKAGNQLGPVLPDLLKAFVTRLATAETASFSQSLILPFAYLIHTQADVVLSLLETIQVAPTAKSPARSGLQVLLSSWCENVDVFQGYWNLKVSSVALVQLFLSQQASLAQISVKGDLLLTAANSNAIMTRARAKNNPDQFSVIPFAAKALKILLHDVTSAGDDTTFSNRNGEMDDDAESDDGDDEWADDGAEFLSIDKDLDFLSDMLGSGGGLAKYMEDNDSNAGEDREDEEDLKDDPVFLLDLRSHLLSFFKGAYEANSNSFRQLAEAHLSASEKETLAQVLQS